MKFKLFYVMIIKYAYTYIAVCLYRKEAEYLNPVQILTTVADALKLNCPCFSTGEL